MGIIDKLKTRIGEKIKTGIKEGKYSEYPKPREPYPNYPPEPSRKRGFMSGVGIGASGVGRGAAAVGKTSASILSDPFSLFRKLFKFIGWLVIIWLFFLFVIFIFGVATTGSGNVFLERVKFILDSIPYSEYVLSKSAQFALFIKTGGASYLSRDYGNFETAVDKNSIEKSGLGINIIDLSTNKGRTGNYKSGEPVIIFGTIKASSLKEKADVKLNCTSLIKKDDGNSMMVSGKLEPEKITVQKERPVFTQVKCSFPKDTFVTDNDIDSAKIRLGAIYDFKTEGYLDVWAMSADEKDRYYSLNFRNPLNDFTDTNIVNKEDGEIRSVYTYGPMSLAIKSDAQPFSEIGPGYSPYYRFLIKMDKNYQWTGNFVRIQDVYIKLADNFELNTETSSEELYRRFVFDKTEGKYKRYRLSHEERDSKLNNLCNDIGVFDLATLGLLSKEENADECLNRLAEGFPIIEFLVKVVNLEGPELRKYSGPIVEVYYEFETYKDVPITIRNPDASGGGTIV